MRYVRPYEDSLRNIGRLFDALEDIEQCFYRIEDQSQRVNISRAMQSAVETAQGIATEMYGRSVNGSDE